MALSPAAPELLTPNSDFQEHVRFAAFGGLAVAVAADASRLDGARAAVERVVADFDLACSRFRDDSELSAVNASPGRAVRISQLLLEAIDVSLRAARLTAGAVDPTVGQALIALGYDRDFELLAPSGPEHPRSPSRLGSSMPRLGAVPGWQNVQLDALAGTVTVPRGVTLDLGATAKALAADRAASAAGAAAGCGVLVSLSGDLAIVGEPPSDGWRIRVTDDHRSDETAPGQWVALSSGGLATSSTTVRRWPTPNGAAHHLIDPATGRSVNGAWRTVSVCAATCLDANIASTASIVRGAEAIGWLEDIGLPSRLVTQDGTVRHVAGWPSEGDDLVRR